MPEDVLFESESTKSRAEIASLFRTVAEKLDDGEEITLRAGDQSVTMSPPEHPTFEIKAEREGPTDGPKELSVEFELEWDEHADAAPGESGALQIE
jgi:amphi-Trp domain-containing protein